MVPSFNTFVVLWNFGPAGLFASCLALKQPFGHLFKALNGRYCNYESMQTNYNSQFLLYFVVRLAAKSKEPVLRRKSSSKIRPFRRQFLIQKRFKRPYLGIYVEFFSLCFCWTCLSHFLIETRIAFLNLGRSCWVIQSYTVGPASPTSEIFRIHRPPYRDYKGLHGLIRVAGDTGVATLSYKVTRLNKVYLCVYRAYVRVYMGV